MAKEKEHIVVFTQEGCPPCDMLKMYIEQKGVNCEVIEVDTDIERKVLQQIFPDIAEVGFPYAIVNNRYVHELMLYLESGL